MFDPDYRTKGWNNSRFAPKHSGTSRAITQLTTALTFMLFGLPLLISPVMEFVVDHPVLYCSAASVVWVAIGFTIRSRAWKQISQDIDATDTEKPMPPPTTQKQPLTREQMLGRLYGVAGALLGFALYIYPPTHAIFTNRGAVLVTGISIGCIALMSLFVVKIIRRVLNLNPQPVAAVPAEKQPPPMLEFPDADPDVAPVKLEPPSMSVPYRDFEHEVAWLINVLTGQKAIVVGGAGDGGVDIKVFSGEKLVGIVQCKRYDPEKFLAPMFIRELSACKQRFNVRTAVMVTTAHFTQDTRQEARQYGVKLIDRDDLVRMRMEARAKVERLRADRQDGFKQ